ncbi:hypothetical protein [Actinoplanes friuliensis]|uniref:hypothetical protein n=1 Tax=Actinoplanes friuliensis TaxID=196914 RepID=UPI0005A0EF65|nr:hypothetical protein [Actinoplanes friuliensis]
MERGSSKHSPRVDEQMSQEVLGTVQGIAGGRAEEWKMAEPPGEDQPEPTRTLEAESANDLSRFGRFVGLSALPGDREALRRSAVALLAPDDVLADLDSLPEGVTYSTVTEIWAALGRGSADRLPE